MFWKNYYKELLLGLLALLILGLYGLFFYFHFYQEEDTDEIVDTSLVVEKVDKKEEKETPSMFVEVKGEVEKPGVYAVTDKTIINDVISLAGGFKQTAYTKNINLSKKVSDEMVINVYSKYEYSLLNKPTIVYVPTECKCPTYDISACTQNGSSVIEKGEQTNANTTADASNASDNKEETKLVNINTATIAELDELDGIGESKAKSIVEYREKNGNFQKIEDITLVSGISEKIFAKIKDSITV